MIKRQTTGEVTISLMKDAPDFRQIYLDQAIKEIEQGRIPTALVMLHQIAASLVVLVLMVGAGLPQP